MNKKNILVTGATSGIGEACARYLSDQGATVILIARNRENLKRISQELSSESYYYEYDLTNLENIEDIFEFCKSKGIKLDGMVHCAGISREWTFNIKNTELLNDTMTLHFFAFLELSRVFCKQKYCNKNSSIVAISSIASKLNDKGMGMYSASKSALNGVVKVIAREVSLKNIRVNAVLPGVVNTKVVNEALPKEELDNNFFDKQPLGMIEPLHVAYLCEYLLSEKAKYITGALIPISGGWY